MELNLIILSIHPVVDGEHETQFMAIHNGHCIGRVGCRVLECDEAGVRQLWVDPQFRRMGVATRLLKHCYDAAAHAGHGIISLGVHNDSTEAWSLYRKQGFHCVGSGGLHLHMSRWITADDLLPLPPIHCAACDRGDFQLGHHDDCPKGN